ncbi:FISUMP domain-containing protein [Fibrobacter sp. UWB10]|uniref:FISUMP domain-containing protein n=1 Tax=Fibrobacter sp. UWB10 TaxID=1896201 RepID=UPI0024036A39|nr:FISUMP domain-containing protein [Fibrobacter sp. UWB10]SMP49091.1 major paralogous domain-containing protein [Fibrobacter sp. UWB10]
MKKSFQRVIATLNLFQGKQSLTIFLFAALFALSACDDSSSASSDETSVSSSSVESSDSSVTLSPSTSSGQAPESAESNGSSDENMEKDQSSSSNAKSSSSAKETKNSSDSKSSSSVKSDDSSSSNKDNSSSSVSSSSSEMQSSSSSVKQSSSSSVLPKSSSSVFEVDSSRLCTPGYAFCNRALGADSMHAGAYKKFTYEGRSYYYLTINGKNQDGKAASVTVMAENLNVGEMVDGNKDQNDDSKIERYCYDNDTMKCEEYGGLYQWAEMMKLPSECNTKSCADSIKPNHQGICPDGWRLLTYDDMYVVVHANGNRNGVADIRSMGFGGFNYSGYGLIGAGYNWNYEFRNIEESAYWHYPEEGRSNDNNIASFVGLQTRSSKSNSTQDTYKTHGFSVRCVKVD